MQTSTRENKTTPRTFVVLERACHSLLWSSFWEHHWPQPRNESTPKCDSVILEQFATPQVLQKSETNATGFNMKYSRFNSYTSNGGEFIPCDNQANHAQSNSDSFQRGPFLERLLECPSTSVNDDQLDGSLTPSLPLAKLNEMDTPQCHSSGFLLNQVAFLNHLQTLS